MFILQPSWKRAIRYRRSALSQSRWPTADSRQPTATARPAFTLVELLTVIIIIGILMALLVPAVMNARVKALDTRMINEIAQLDSAMKQFRTNYAVLPPAVHLDNNGFGTANGADENRVRAMWRRAWPRWNNSNGVPSASPPAPGTNVETMSPAEVLVFYLGGMPGTVGTKVTGFNLNPLNPASAGGQRSTPLFQFDQGRLLDEYPIGAPNGLYEYYPPHKVSVGDGVPPYVYFDTGTYAHASAFYNHGNAGTYGTARPYLDAAVAGRFMNADSFQIIGAGLDNNYGASGSPPSKVFPTGTNYVREDADNVSNFSTVRLEEAKP